MKQHHSSQPIGIFDSGIGGLTVANAILDALPNESIIYFGDTFHLPYGDKSGDAIRYYCLKIVKFLLEKNCKMIVIACNSASSAAYQVLLDFFKNEALFVNVVDPLVQEVARNGFQEVGVIATKATISTNIYKRKLVDLQPNIIVDQLATPLLAPMIEEGFVANNISKAVLDNYLGHSELKNIEALLLACTHYPLIRSAIDEFYQHNIKIFDSTIVVANEVKQLLQENHLLNNSNTQPSHHFYVSDYTDSFEQTTKVFFGKSVHLEYEPIWQ
mgnify:CR=1 FL=1